MQKNNVTLTDQDEYFEYLQQRGRIGFVYRKYWLYPRLARLIRGKALDVGCGIGDFLKFRPNTVGVDINPNTVEWCKKQGLNAYLMKVDELPFESGAFNSVIFDNVLEHIENPEKILSGIRRVLIDGGIFVVGVPGKLGYTKDADHKVFYSESKLLDTLEKAGFSKGKVFSMPLNLKLLDNFISQYCVYGVFYKS